MGDQEVVIEQVSVSVVSVVVDETMEDVAMEDSIKKPFIGQDHDGAANGNAAVEDAVPAEPPVEDVIAPVTEEDRLWGMVKANSGDFSNWTLLILETEKLDAILKIRKVYDSFLGEFPLCYGYWKKYADHEARLGTPEKIVEVYEQAVKAVTYSVEIWMHYTSHAMEKVEDPEDIRRLFERGVAYVGSDYHSHFLWDKYIDFEYSQQEWSRLAQIYTRILQIPLFHLDRYYNSFKQIASSRPLAELRSAEEIAEAATAVSVEVAAVDVGSEAPPGDAEAPKVEKPSEAEELEKFIGLREALYKKAKDWDAKIRDFETAIRRPYFHVKSLDDIQLGNWHRYLDFIEKEGDTDKVVKLYERCLIACANYPEYWIRYVQRLEVEGNEKGANDALERSTTVFVKRRPEIHLFAARFKETQGDIEGARAEYDRLDTELAPGLLEAIIKHANFQQRQGNMEAAIKLFTSAIDAEKVKEESRSLPLLYIQYARFLDQVAGKADAARELYLSALEHLPRSKVLWEAVILFESMHSEGKQILRLDALVEQATSALRADGSVGLSAAEREEISSIYLEIVDLFGDVQIIKKAETRHKSLFPPRKLFGDSKKRPSPEGNITQATKVHKPYGGSHAVASPAPAPPVYANGQAQWGGGYGPQGYVQQPQGWQQPPPQQAPPVQPQQWNPGYGGQQDMQGGYGGYGGYAGYGPPQQQAPPQQPQAAYGGYGQQYPPQDFSQQQSYPQGAPSYRAPLPPAAPQAAVAQQQGYYAGYY